MGLCERCKKVQATYHLTNLTPEGDKVERHLCERCAIEEGLVQVHKPAVSIDVLEEFVGGTKGSAAATLHELVCQECGLSYVEFRNQGLLGCPHDYDAFSEPLKRLVERAHDGGTHHVGKSPKSLGVPRTTQQDIFKLRKQLDDAISAEDYERAAALRDRIRELEAK